MYDQRDKSRQAKPVSFYVKDEQSGMDVTVRWSSHDETLKLFKEKDFSYLFNGQYIPAPVRQELRAQSELLIKQGQNLPIPRIEDTNTSSGTSNNNDDIKAYS